MQQLSSLAKGGEENNFLQMAYVIMRDFGYTLEEFRSLPIPTLGFLLEIMKKESERQNNQYRKMKR